MNLSDNGNRPRPHPLTGTISEETLGEIVRRILTVCQPDRIILFGSAANGQMTRDSDIDLLVLEAEVADAREETLRIREALTELPFPFDVLVMERDRFEESRNVIGGIAWPAARYGKVVYEAERYFPSAQRFMPSRPSRSC